MSAVPGSHKAAKDQPTLETNSETQVGTASDAEQPDDGQVAHTSDIEPRAQPSASNTDNGKSAAVREVGRRCDCELHN